MLLPQSNEPTKSHPSRFHYHLRINLLINDVQSVKKYAGGYEDMNQQIQEKNEPMAYPTEETHFPFVKGLKQRDSTAIFLRTPLTDQEVPSAMYASLPFALLPVQMETLITSG